MSFFETVESSVVNHGLWAEKYRPRILDDYICEQQLREVLSNFIKKQDVPHLLFYGSAGVGKSSLAQILTNNIRCDVLYVNASDQNGIDFIREKIKPFAATSGFSDKKIVILDEADGLTQIGQSALRNMMETYSASTRFILTCNYVEKIINPLISRCQTFKIEPPAKKDVALYVKNILDKESIKYELKDLKKSIDDFYPDIRKIVNFIQQNSSDGILKLIQNQSAGYDLKNKLIDSLKKIKTNSGVFNEIRQLVNDAGTRMFEELYSELYDKVDEYATNNQVDVIISISEHIYQSSMVVDKEITFMACIAKIIKLLK